MKKLNLLYLSIFSLYFLSITSCVDDNPIGDLGKGSFTINIKANYNNQPFVILKHYPWRTDDSIQFLGQDFYLGALKLDNKSLTPSEPKLIDISGAYITTNSEGISLTFNDVPAGDYSNISFSVGVPSDLNAKKPADFERSSDLSKTSHYWEAWDSYIFSKTEGKADLNQDGIYESSFSYHTGRNDMYRTLNFNKAFTINNDANTLVNFDFDVKKLLSNSETGDLDIATFSNSHSESQIATAAYIMDNYQRAITVK